MKRLLLTFISFGLCACGALHSGDPGVSVNASTGVVTAESLQAFDSTMYAFGQTQGCVKCHGKSVNPLWMSSNLSTAYSFARPFVDFNNPSASVFAVNAGNNHCGDPVCAVPANVAVVQDLLAQWAAVELNQTGGPPAGGGSTLPTPPFATATMAIPTSIPLLTSGQAAIVRFDLSALKPSVPVLNGAILELSIQLYNSAGTTYRIFNARIAGGAGPVNMNGIHVYVRPSTGTGIGTEDVNQGLYWANLNASAPNVALPAPLPAGPMTTVSPFLSSSLGLAVQSAADMITVGFSNIH